MFASARRRTLGELGALTFYELIDQGYNFKQRNYDEETQEAYPTLGDLLSSNPKRVLLPFTKFQAKQLSALTHILTVSHEQPTINHKELHQWLNKIHLSILNNPINDAGETVLHRAIDACKEDEANLKALQLLLQAGADPSIACKAQATPLFNAAYSLSHRPVFLLEVVKLLLNTNKSNVNQPNKEEGFTVLDVVQRQLKELQKQSNNSSSSNSLEDVKVIHQMNAIIELLKAHGAQPGQYASS